MNEDLKIDGNDKGTVGFVTDDANQYIRRARIDDATKGLKVMIVGGSVGSGTVTSVSVVTANGFSGTVATATTTPAITLATTVTGIIKGNGTAITAAVSNTDYQAPISLTTTGSSGAATFDGTTLNIPQYTGAGGGTVVSVASADGSVTVTDPSSTVDLAVVKSPILSTARTIGGVSFNGSANITVATATGGFAVSGGDLAVGSNNLTITGSVGSTGSRSLKGWFTDLQVTNAIAGSVTGNAATATALATGRTISISGDMTYASPAFDGTGNVTAAGTLATVNSNVGSFTNVSITVNAKGLVTAASNGTTAVTSVAGTSNRITVTGTTSAVVDIAATYVGQASITTVGTVATGTWNGTLVGPTYGGTGINNGSSTLTIAGNVTHAGSFTQSFTATGNTAITLPTTGMLATLAGSEALTNKSVNGVTLTTGGGTTTFLNANGSYSTPASGGTPGGSNTQVQYNNSSAFGGISGVTTDGTIMTTTVGSIGTGITTNGFVIQNSTAATVGTTRQYSPLLLLSGTSYRSIDTSSATQTWSIQGKPQNGTNSLNNILEISSSSVGVGTSSLLRVTNNDNGGSSFAFGEAATFGTGLIPGFNDGGGLGLATVSWSDLFLASGGVVNFANGDYTLTHATGILTANKDLRVTTAGTNAASVITQSSTNTVTNKRWTRRFITTTQSATPTVNTDNTDISSITGLAQAITSMTTNLSGTPSAGDYLQFQITDNGTARAITWGTSFAATTVALPTTTVISTLLRIGFQWDTVSAKWQCIAVA